MPVKPKKIIMIKSVSSQALLIIFITIIIVIVGLILKQNSDKSVQNPPKEELKILSTNPSPLEDATILPTGFIEITLNKPVVTSEFKHRFDPELEHEVEVINGINSSYGKTFKLHFKKPLQLGSGYTLFILPNTHTEDGLKLDKEIIYHFKTIGYRGV